MWHNVTRFHKSQDMDMLFLWFAIEHSKCKGFFKGPWSFNQQMRPIAPVGQSASIPFCWWSKYDSETRRLCQNRTSFGKLSISLWWPAPLQNQGSLAEPSPGEGTEDPYSKAPETATTDTTEGEAAKDPPAETATAETQGEGTEDPYSKAPEAPAEAPAETPAAETAPAKTPAAEAPAETPAEAPAETPAAETAPAKTPAAEAPAETPAEAPAETPAAETAPAKTPAAETAPADSTEGEGTEDPYSKAPEDTATADSTADAEETEESTHLSICFRV